MLRNKSTNINIQAPMLKWEFRVAMIYLPIHCFVLPIFFGYLPILLPGVSLTHTQVNMLYYGMGLFFCLVVMGKYLRRNFDTLLDGLLHCVISFAVGVSLNFILSLLLYTILELTPLDLGVSPNDASVDSMSEIGYGPTLAIVVFMAPIVEEVLYRGLMFGSIYNKVGRKAAYIISVLFFAFLHTWQFVAASGDLTLFIYMLNYIPAGVALAYSYERSGSLWVPIAFHMFVNYMAMSVV